MPVVVHKNMYLCIRNIMKAQEKEKEEKEEEREM